MKKKYLSVFALVVTTSIIFSTHNTLALDNVTQPTSSATSTNTTSTNATTSTNTTSSTTEPAAQPVDNTTLNLSLEDALKDIETGNSTLKLADSQILIYDKQNQQALARHNANTAIVDEDSRKDRDLNYKRTQWTLDNAKHDRNDTLKSLRAQITNEYENILTLQQKGKNLKTQLADLQTIIDQVNLQIKLGLKIQSDIYSYTANQSKLEAAQKANENSIDSSMIALKQDLGIDINRNVVLTSSQIPYTKFDDSDINNLIAKAVQNSYDIPKTQQDIDISQIEHDIDFYYSDTQTADQVEISIENKKATLADLPNTLVVGFRTAYNNLKSMENNIEADKLTVEADQINVNNMQKNIDVGTSSSPQLLNLQDTLLNDQNTLQQDINAYMTAVTNFQNSLDN